MISIIKDRSLIPKGSIVFDNFDAFVNVYVTAKDFTNLDIYALKEVDNAKLIDRDTGLVQTEYGYTAIEMLSTGCKAVLTYLYYMRNRDSYRGDIVFNINECGWNAIDVLFDCVERLNDSSTVFCLEHQDGLFNCKKRDYLINNKERINDLLFI